jgi:hypothetical protein
VSIVSNITRREPATSIADERLDTIRSHFHEHGYRGVARVPSGVQHRLTACLHHREQTVVHHAVAHRNHVDGYRVVFLDAVRHRFHRFSEAAER